MDNQLETGELIIVQLNKETPISKGQPKDIILLNSSSGTGSLKLRENGVTVVTVPIAGQAIIIVRNTTATGLESDVNLSGSFTLKDRIDGLQNEVTYVPLQLSTAVIKNIYLVNGFTATTSEVLNFNIIGSASVSTLNGGNLNMGNVIGVGNLFSFNMGVVAGTVYTFTNATFVLAVTL